MVAQEFEALVENARVRMLPRVTVPASPFYMRRTPAHPQKLNT